MLKVLALDADQRLLQNLKSFFHEEGIEIVIADQGIYAPELLNQMHFDAVVMEIVLPGDSGLDLLRLLKKERRTTILPVFVTSSLGRKAERMRAIRNGAWDFIAKPYDFDELAARIKNAVEHVREIAMGTTGKFAVVKLRDFLNRLSLEKKSGRLRVNINGVDGEIRLQEGRVVDVLLGRSKGLSLLNTMLNTTQCRHFFEEQQPVGCV